MGKIAVLSNELLRGRSADEPFQDDFHTDPGALDRRVAAQDHRVTDDVGDVQGGGRVFSPELSV